MNKAVVQSGDRSRHLCSKIEKAQKGLPETSTLCLDLELLSNLAEFHNAYLGSMKREATLIFCLAVRELDLLSGQQVYDLGALFTKGIDLMGVAMRAVIKNRLQHNSNLKEPYLEAPLKFANKLMKIWKEAANEIQNSLKADGGEKKEHY